MTPALLIMSTAASGSLYLFAVFTLGCSSASRFRLERRFFSLVLRRDIVFLTAPGRDRDSITGRCALAETIKCGVEMSHVIVGHVRTDPNGISGKAILPVSSGGK